MKLKLTTKEAIMLLKHIPPTEIKLRTEITEKLSEHKVKLLLKMLRG